jgi:hypothetical protein
MIVAAFGLLGCTSEDPPAAIAPPPPVAASSGEVATEVPQPAALLDVLTRISDPSVAGGAKIGLIENATAADGAALDAFTAALRDNRWTPLTFSVTGITRSERQPGVVIADVAITPAGPNPAPFSFPMEFTTTGGNWQLTRHTADLLLDYGR